MNWMVHILLCEQQFYCNGFDNFSLEANELLNIKDFTSISFGCYIFSHLQRNLFTLHHCQTSLKKRNLNKQIQEDLIHYFIDLLKSHYRVLMILSDDIRSFH